MEFSSEFSLELISTAGRSHVLQQLSWPAASQRAETENELNSKAERVDLSVRGVHCSLSKTPVALAASPHGTMSEDRSDSRT